jgi:hypothetical protein
MQGWLFAMAKSIFAFARQWNKTGKNRQKPTKTPN